MPVFAVVLGQDEAITHKLRLICEATAHPTGKTQATMTRLALALTLALTACGGDSPGDDTVTVDGGIPVTGDGSVTGTDAPEATCPAPPASLCSYIARQDDITGMVDTVKAQTWADTYLAGQTIGAGCALANGEIWHMNLTGAAAVPGAPCPTLCDVAAQGTAALDAWAQTHLMGQNMTARCVLVDGSTWTQDLHGPAGW